LMYTLFPALYFHFIKSQRISAVYDQAKGTIVFCSEKWQGP